ncbi:MAG: FAD binding domain-containing protein [Acidimicrobiales bacterium]|jgi:CO/xanthine dehydrogenase FAD-binding subunit
MMAMFEPAVDTTTPMAAAPGALENAHARVVLDDWERRWYGEPRFNYELVRSYEEAVFALREHGEGAKALAGGQSLVPLMNLRLLRPSALIDLNGIGASAPQLDGGRLWLSAMTRYSQVLVSELARFQTPLLTTAIAYVGNVRVRNRGTIGGALAHGQATSELAAVALALGGEILAYGPTGTRVIDAEEFFVGHLKTDLRPEEVVTGLRLEAAQPRQGSSFKELARRSGAEAIAGVAANITLSPERDVIGGVRLGLIGVDEHPVAGDRTVLSALVGRIPTPAEIDEVASQVTARTAPVTDSQSTASYRRRLVRVLIRRALTEALERAEERASAE